eukprot:Nk52_evm7s2284 gene=Nk52_evmTU7s2284
MRTAHPGNSDIVKVDIPGGNNDDDDDDDSKDASSNADKSLFQVLPPIGSLFRFADGKDFLLMAIGTIGALTNGATFGINALLYGQMVQHFADYGQDVITKSEFLSSTEETALYFLCLGLVCLAASYLQTAFWMISSERQADKMRKAYILSLLNQHIGWYDVHGSDDFTSMVAGDMEKIGQAIGMKFGAMLQDIACVVSGLIVAFIASWKLTLVMLAMSPVLSISFWFFGRGMAQSAGKEQAINAKASKVAQEAIGNIKTVFAFGGEEREKEKYNSHLQDALQKSLHRGKLLSLMIGSMSLIIYCTYAAGFGLGLNKSQMDR